MTFLGGSCAGAVVALDGPDGSFPTQHILWFLLVYLGHDDLCSSNKNWLGNSAVIKEDAVCFDISN